MRETEAGKEILEGNFVIPEDIDLYLKNLLEHLRMPENIKKDGDFNMELDYKDNARFWKKQKISTLAEETSPGFSKLRAAEESKKLLLFDATFTKSSNKIWLFT